MTPIFAGTWIDGDGVPFTPDAYAREESVQGKQCQPRNFNGSRRDYAGPHTAALRWLRDQWFTVLTQQQRDGWETLSGGVRPDRQQILNHTTGGWMAFANRNWPVAFGYAGIFIAEPQVPEISMKDPVFLSASAATQTITIRLEYYLDPSTLSYMTTYLYQIDPMRVHLAQPHKLTRLARAFRDFVPLQLIYDLALSARWPIVAGDTVKVFVKHTLALDFQHPAIASGVVT